MAGFGFGHQIIYLIARPWPRFTTSSIPSSSSTLAHRFDGRHLDFTPFFDGNAQYSHLITRRCRELSVYAELMPCTTNLDEIKFKPKGFLIALRSLTFFYVLLGIILSGSPYSVYDEGSPHADPRIYSLGIPILGICYGLQVCLISR
jgi:Glutamine amidotransferase class-I